MTIATNLKNIAALALTLALLGCASSGGTSNMASPTEGTNAPIGGGINVTAGTEEDFMVNVGRRTFFKQSSAELDDTARVTLDKQAEWLNQHPQWKVKLQGSADDPGSVASQKALSQKRADAVRNYLSSRGIAPERMLAKGYGRDKIGEDCPEIECKSQNRRVVTNLQENPEF
ncbi:OmpA family protein [Aestuariivirga sp. YIM B02566]|uniref:OmpA family protein n=1 Tax=Taklimakanibacter albus TaxID=2800327 RepID=A0ACC5RFG2_9HYPH|nr:OmpA family protein [Aestuariivirga sp. YIM B02566]MBK1871362.1 OmpA family protein [Aestuariivirga sp. YIM B02566]